MPDKFTKRGVLVWRDAVAGIRLVGGAALALRYVDRAVTHDVDALHINPGG